MKYQEELNNLFCEEVCLSSAKKYNCFGCNDIENCVYRKSKEALQELIDREAPKKPILKKDVDLGIDYDDVYVCPKCGTVVSDLVKPEFCSKCGQHLDWEDRKVK